MKGKLKKLILATLVMVPCALTLSACGDKGGDPGVGGGPGGICKDNSCQYTEIFNPTDFLKEPFYNKVNEMGLANNKIAGYKYNDWVQEMFGYAATPNSYDIYGEEPVSYYVNHIKLCKQCGNIKLEKHNFVHVEDVGGFNHSIKCTDCNYTHDAYCYFEINTELLKEDEKCICGQSEPNYSVNTDPDNSNGVCVTINSDNTGDIVIPRIENGKPVTEVRISGGSNFINQQITSLTIPYTAINGLELPANNHIEKIIISGVTEEEAIAFEETIESLQNKLEAGEIEPYEFEQQMEELHLKYLPYDDADYWLKVNNLSNLKSISVLDNNVILSGINLVEVNNCANLETFELDTRQVVFENCPSLTKLVAGGISFHDELTHPQNLTEITLLNETLGTLPACVKTINLPEGHKTIKNQQFAGLTNIETINAPDVVEIKNSSFAGCTSLKTINAPKVTTIGDSAFDECTSLETVNFAELTTIGWSAFSNCEKLKTFNFSKVTSIDDGAFYNCKLLETADLSSVTSLGGNSFANCAGLKSVTLSSQLTEIEYTTFNSCSSLEELTIPASVTKIASGSISNCTGMKKLYYNATNAVVSSSYSPFEGLGDDVAEGCEFIVGKDVESLPEYLTYRNGIFKTNITKFTFEDGSKLKNIQPYAIACIKITNLTLPNSLETVSDSAIYSCPNLTAIDMGSLTLTSKIMENCSNYEYELSNGLYYFSKTLVGVADGTTTIAPREGTISAEEADGLTFISSTTKSAVTTVTMPNTIENWNVSFQGFTNLENITLSTNLKEISANMFYGNSKLTSITFPNSVTKIGSYAFVDCVNLQDVVIPSSVTTIECSAFAGCTKLTNLTLNNGLESIGSHAFKNCNMLASITLPSTVREIGPSAFANCGSQTNSQTFAVTLNEGLEKIGESVFVDSLIQTITIPSTVTEISLNAFGGCTKLTTITIPNTVTTFGERLFSGCTNLESVTLPSNITTIPSYMFLNCSKLEEITIPETVTTISDYAFQNCVLLSNIILEGEVTITDLAVDGCTSYKGQVWNNGYYKGTVLTGLVDSTVSFVYIKDGTTEIASGVFAGLTSLKGVYIPESVTTITNGEFSGCTNATIATGSNRWLNQLLMAEAGYSNTLGATKCVNELAYATLDGWLYTIPSSNTTKATYVGTGTEIIVPETLGDATQISISGFEGNTEITKVVLSDSVIAITENAFKDCTSLQEVTIGDGVQLIYLNAFKGCTGLTTLNINFTKIYLYSSDKIPGYDTDDFEIANTISNNALINVLTDIYSNYIWLIIR